MNLFEINFLDKMSTLLKEAFKFKKYKAMHPVFAVLVGLFMLPVVVASFAVTALVAILGFIYEVVSAPVRSIHGIVNKEGKEAMHATQFIIYLVSWPLIFVAYVVIALMLVVIFPLYALLSFVLYVWTLGGFKFHLFPSFAEDISIEVKGTYRVLPIVFIAVSAVVLLIVPFVDGFTYYLELYKYYLEGEFVASFFGNIYLGYIGIHAAIAVLYSLIAFAPNPKAKAVIEAKPAPVAEPVPAEEVLKLDALMP